MYPWKIINIDWIERDRLREIGKGIMLKANYTADTVRLINFIFWHFMPEF